MEVYHLSSYSLHYLEVSSQMRGQGVVPTQKMSVPLNSGLYVLQTRYRCCGPGTNFLSKLRIETQATVTCSPYWLSRLGSLFPQFVKSDCEFSTTLFFPIFWISVCSYGALHLGFGRHFGSLSYRLLCGRHTVLKKKGRILVPISYLCIEEQKPHTCYEFSFNFNK